MADELKRRTPAIKASSSHPAARVAVLNESLDADFDAAIDGDLSLWPPLPMSIVNG